LTSIPSDRGPVFLEFPNFGYGPASTVLTLARAVGDRFDWHVVSTGGAAQFVRSQLPGAVLHDVDTFSPEHWPAFVDIAPPGSLIVSGTNPEFAAWAIRHGYRVGLIDTLDWMWPALPHDLGKAEFHLVQAYFASPLRAAEDGREVVRPIVDPALWPTVGASPRGGAVLIGFGGMHLPGGDSLVAAYVRWFLRAALPVLIDHAKASEITIAGGRADLADLVPDPWRNHPAVRVHAAMDRTSYARAARAAEHLLLSPGLASIYECAAAQLTPLWQPGFSMSMLLQVRHLLGTGYPQVASWPWQVEAADHIAGLPEADGVQHVANRIAATINDADPAGDMVRTALHAYLERSTDAPDFRVPVDSALPDGAALFTAHLERLM
jgi:hypothetical protein